MAEKKQPPKMKRTTIFLPQWQVESLQEDFEKTGVRPSESIRRALDQWFGDKKRVGSIAKRYRAQPGEQRH
jgi:hypothetical protein